MNREPSTTQAVGVLFGIVIFFVVLNLPPVKDFMRETAPYVRVGGILLVVASALVWLGYLKWGWLVSTSSKPNTTARQDRQQP